MHAKLLIFIIVCIDRGTEGQTNLMLQKTLISQDALHYKRALLYALRSDGKVITF
jgi:hypothetical protein